MTKRILVAEDVEVIAELLREILASSGFAVEIVGDGALCLERARATRPDLVILDIMMPKLHGLDVLRRIRETPELGATRVVIYTAKDYKPDLDRARELGAAAILSKTASPTELLRAVTEILADRPLTTGDSPAAEIKEIYRPAPAAEGLSFKLWGTRGSIPVSAASHLRHGGNTTCVAFESGGELVVIDAGTGIRELGQQLASRGPRRIHLFISHTHWDHIQGFPFFAPIYIPGFKIMVHGASGYGRDLQDIFRDQLDRDYFPVQIEDMGARLEFIRLEEKPVRIGAMTVGWEFTHHPGAALGFRVEAEGRSAAILCDNEFLKGYLGNPARAVNDRALLAPSSKIVEFVAGADLLIGEAQYTNAEYATKVGWGHSSVSNAALLARLAGIPRWIVVHHDPMHDDHLLQQKLIETRRVFAEMNYAIEVENGFDGMIGEV